ncbi:MAG: hypothetical protein ACI4FY_04595 [Acetatifactor sp.]
MTTITPTISPGTREKQIESLRASQQRDRYQMNAMCQMNRTASDEEVPIQTSPHSTFLLRTILSIAAVLTVITLDSGKIKIAEIGSNEIFELLSADYSASMKNWLQQNIYYRPVK